MIAGQVSDYTSAGALLDDLPEAEWLLGKRGYDAEWFRDALQPKGIQPCTQISQQAGQVRQAPLPAPEPRPTHRPC